MDVNDMITRIRTEIGDPLQPFMTNNLGDGFTQLYDLPKQNIDPDSLVAYIVSGASTTTLNPDTDFDLNSELGFIELSNPVPNGATLITQGNAWGMFTDSDLTTYIAESVRQHTHGRTITERKWSKQGWITYREEPVNLSNLPPIEEPLLVMLTTINVFWTLANDAATDANIQTAEGTNVDRTGRYAQLMGHIADLQERYERYSGQLNVGVFRDEVLKLRRFSRTTGRLVPLFREREYDDHRWPQRELPQIDIHNEDDSGIPSPLWNASGY